MQRETRQSIYIGLASSLASLVLALYIRSSVSIAICIACAAVFFVKAMKPEWIAGALKSAIALAVAVSLAVSVSRFEWFNEKANTPTVSKSEPGDPRLDAQMIVDQATTGQTAVRFQITNGPEKISNLQTFISTNGLSSAFLLPLPELDPGEHREVPAPMIMSDVRPMQLGFMVTFSAGGKTYYAIFNYLVQSGGSGLQPFSPVSTQRGVGNLDGQQEQALRVLVQNLSREEGTNEVVFPEVADNGMPNQIAIRNGKRQLLIDAGNNRIAFQNGSKIIQGVLTGDRTAKADHIAFVMWNDKSGLTRLVLDGQLIRGSDPWPNDEKSSQSKKH